MKAEAALAVGSGITTLRSDPPLAIRPTPSPGEPGVAVHLVGTAAGPLAGDELHLDVSVAGGAILTVRSAAATLVQPGPVPGASTSVTSVRVGANGHLAWQLEPTVLVRGCDHHSTVDIHLDRAATLVWRDEVVLGRHGEPSGSLLARLRIDRCAGPLLRNDLVVGPRWPGSQGPAGVGDDTRAVGTVVLVGPAAAELAGQNPADGVRSATLVLAEDAVVVTAVAPAPGRLSAALDAITARVREPCPA